MGCISICHFPKICAANASVLVYVILTVFLLGSVLNGCLPCYYAPGAQNVPLFTGKKQANLSGAYKIGMYTQGCDFQTAVSVADHAALLANYSYFFGKDPKPGSGGDYTDRFHSHSFDIGMGYFLPMANKFVFETFAGYGFNKISNKYEENYANGSSMVHSSSFFLQPAIGFHKKNVELAVSTRFRLVNYERIEFTDNVEDETVIMLRDLDRHSLNYFLEPAFTVRMGGEMVKVQIQVGLSTHLDKDFQFDYDPLNANFGLIFKLREKQEHF